MANITITDNYIKYYEEILKISNISRMWIFRFQNIAKRRYEEERLNYQKDKTQYEKKEKFKKEKSIKTLLAIAGILLAVLISSFYLGRFDIGMIILCVMGLLFYKISLVYKKEIVYPHDEPKGEKFPDKFGLGIEMNSGYKVTFTAIGVEGRAALRALQNDIKNADIHENAIYFNMNDYNISIENNDGIISTGHFSNNISQRGLDQL